jgi:hypothetical protein
MSCHETHERHEKGRGGIGEGKSFSFSSGSGASARREHPISAAHNAGAIFLTSIFLTPSDQNNTRGRKMGGRKMDRTG